MQLIRVGAAVLNQTPLDWDGNQARIQAATEAAHAKGVSILCLPELCITGYGCEDAFQSPDVQLQAMRVLFDLVKRMPPEIVVSYGLPVLFNGALFNAACLVASGEILGFVGKQHLAGDGIHYEPRWFKPWPEGTRTSILVNEPYVTIEDGEGGLFTSTKFSHIGDLVFDVGDVRIGFEICEDAWVADRPGQRLARRGVDIILNPSASHFAFGKHEIRERFVIEGSRAFHVGYVYANLLGNEAGRAIYDGDAMIAAAGKMLATGPRFSYADWHVTSAVLDLDQIRMGRVRSATYVPLVDDPLADRHGQAFSYPQIHPVAEPSEPAAWETSPHIKEEEFTRAVSLALFDYLRKSRSQGFVVSLSGGADSTAVSYLTARMVDFALAEIGREGLLHKLGYVRGLEAAGDAKALVHRLLSCVYQATRNSGEVTRSAARTVAEALGAEYFEFDVDRVVEEYKSLVAKGLGRELSWQTDDVALQNIQARARAPGVWMLANLRGALLLSTSNRSEAAVGYATMDGDTSGGLAPIAGIDKAFLRRWLVWCEQQGPAGIGPLPALAAVNRQAPTAELRPQAARQTDEDDLMPYELLDAVERAAILDKQSPREIWLVMQAKFPAYSAEQLVTWIERFFRLWSRNQWKRERYAPSFHLDDESLDPKTWCRFPILSGGYERELKEMREQRMRDKG